MHFNELVNLGEEVLLLIGLHDVTRHPSLKGRAQVLFPCVACGSVRRVMEGKRGKEGRGRGERGMEGREGDAGERGMQGMEGRDEGGGRGKEGEIEMDE